MDLSGTCSLLRVIVVIGDGYVRSGSVCERARGDEVEVGVRMDSSMSAYDTV
jgi:hypothetical protein